MAVRSGGERRGRGRLPNRDSDLGAGKKLIAAIAQHRPEGDMGEVADSGVGRELQVGVAICGRGAHDEFLGSCVAVLIGIGGWVNLGASPEIKILPPSGDVLSGGKILGFNVGESDGIGYNDCWVRVVAKTDEAVSALGKIHGGCDQFPGAAAGLLVYKKGVAAAVVRNCVRGIVGAVAALRIPNIHVVFAGRGDFGPKGRGGGGRTGYGRRVRVVS